jgi:hypothetical protein
MRILAFSPQTVDAERSLNRPASRWWFPFGPAGKAGLSGKILTDVSGDGVKFSGV